MTPKKIASWLLQGASFIVLFLCISFVLDIIRKPDTTHFQITSNALSTKAKPIAYNTNNTSIVYVWGSWCGVCGVVSPAINTIYEKNSNIMSIALASGSDSEINQYLKKKGLNFPVINNETYNLADTLDIQAVPVILFVKNGAIKHAMTGYHHRLDIQLRLWLIETFT